MAASIVIFGSEGSIGHAENGTLRAPSRLVGDITGADLGVFGTMLVGLMLAGVGIARDALATRRAVMIDPPPAPEEAKRAA